MTTEQATKPERFMLMRDDSGHWYVIPADKLNEFEIWDWDSGRLPEWAKEVNGSHTLVTFTDPKIR